MPESASPYFLPAAPRIERALQTRVTRDYERFADENLPADLEGYLLDEYDLDVAAEYAGVPIANPWGKASGQLSMTARQVQDDVEAGLGFVVLKTVIAQNETGTQSMRAWAIPESRMAAERIVGQSGEPGWTISWKGRGWWQSFEEYLQLVREARKVAANSQTLIVPSCKFHLPTPEETGWKTEEYDHTVQRLLEAWSDVGRENHPFTPSPPHPRNSQSAIRNPQSAIEPMPLEKDFSPTLAGSDLAAVRSQILEWLRVVPRLVHAAAESAEGTVRLGLKIFNAMFDDDFQVEMLRVIQETFPGSRIRENSDIARQSSEFSRIRLREMNYGVGGSAEPRAHFFVYGNRLFDPDREFDGHRGIAYGGPDLSDRNLRVLSRFRQESNIASPLPLSATGNITTGKMAVEYALRGAGSFQLHTFFQLPAEVYRMKSGSKTQKALHELYFHPETGFIVWLHHAAAELLPGASPVRFLDVVRASGG